MECRKSAALSKIAHVQKYTAHDPSPSLAILHELARENDLSAAAHRAKAKQSGASRETLDYFVADLSSAHLRATTDSSR
jgi:hypothetical protein